MAGSPQRPPLFRGGSAFVPRLGIDVLVNPGTGLLRSDRGMSLFDDPTKVERPGGAYQVDSIPDDLKIQQRGRDPGHYELMPAEPMTFERYVDLLDQVILHAYGGS